MKEEKIKISVNQEDVQNIINCYEKDIERIKQLEEIIKEAREYIKEHIRIDDEYPTYMEMLITERDELDEILSKGENKWKEYIK